MIHQHFRNETHSHSHFAKRTGHCHFQGCRCNVGVIVVQLVNDESLGKSRISGAFLFKSIQKIIRTKFHDQPNANNPSKEIMYEKELLFKNGHTYVLLYSEAHFMLIALGKIGLNLQRGVMLTGLGGLLGSTPGLLVGIGLGSWTCLPLTCTTTLGGNSSDSSTVVVSAVNGKNLN